MDKINVSSIFAIVVLYICKYTLRVFPGSSSLVKLSAWARLHYHLNQDEEAAIQADYYNDSESDVINLFRELKYLADEGHCFHGDYLLKRVNFLAKEGLNITDSANFQEYRKLSIEEINKIVQVPKPKIKRDKKGKFVPKKKNTKK